MYSVSAARAGPPHALPRGATAYLQLISLAAAPCAATEGLWLGLYQNLRDGPGVWELVEIHLRWHLRWNLRWNLVDLARCVGLDLGPVAAGRHDLVAPRTLAAIGRGWGGGSGTDSGRPLTLGRGTTLVLMGRRGRRG